jgi:SAM-dependent methyltransferase
MDATRSEDSHGYEDEPREYFSPLPEHLAPLYYDLCSSADTSDVCYFYDQLRFNGCRHVLELGCGTGRISSHLVAKELTVVGVDICRPMLAHPRHRPSTVVAMDMRALGFTRSFEAAIIGCNTLNLLVTKEQIGLCLSQVYKILTGPALLLLQLFVPDRLLLHNPETGFFQASVHDMGDGGKLVKEVIRTYRPAQPDLLYTERYKLRYTKAPEQNINYHQQQTLAAFSPQTWFNLLADAGFTLLSRHGGRAATPFFEGNCTTLYIAARAVPPKKNTTTGKRHETDA